MNREKTNMFRTDRRVLTISFICVLVSIILSTAVSMYSLRLMADDNQKDVSMLLTARVHDEINSELTEPVMVAKTMANNRFLLDFLEKEESMEGEQSDIGKMQEYLKRLKTELAYDSAFVISDATKRYYTGEGLNKIIDVDNDAHDIWYSIFVSGNEDYDLDVDSDEVNGNVWTVFVNARMENNGKLLGVCGVGVKMNEIQNLLSEYEEEYGVKINLIDSDGLVQVDTDEINIENAYLDEVDISEKASSEYVYQEGANGEYIVNKYVENLGWYLVVQSKGQEMQRELPRVIFLNAVLFSLVALGFIFISYLMRHHTRLLMKSSYLDELTGIRNRRAYEEEIDRLSKEKTKPDFVYINADINGLKKVNDTLGHAAGDEYIRGAAECLQNAFGRYGNVFRTGGDEFAAILYISPEEYDKVKESLQDSIRNWHGVLVNEMSISVGYVPGWETEADDVEKIIEEADRRMYQAKKEYYLDR